MMTKFQEYCRTQFRVKLSLGKNKTISSNFCHSMSNWNRVYIKYKKYNHNWNSSAGFGLFIKLTKKIHKIPRVFQENREINCLSRCFPGPWKIISKFQEFSRNSRSNEHHTIVFQYIVWFTCWIVLINYWSASASKWNNVGWKVWSLSKEKHKTDVQTVNPW